MCVNHERGKERVRDLERDGKMCERERLNIKYGRGYISG